MNNNEMILLLEKSENKEMYLKYFLKRILNINNILLDGYSKIHIISTIDIDKVNKINIPKNMHIHQISIWQEKKGFTRLIYHMRYFFNIIKYTNNILKKNNNITTLMNLTNHMTLGFIIIFFSKLYGKNSIIRVCNDVNSAIFTFNNIYGAFLGKVFSALIYKIEKIVFYHANIIISVSYLTLEKYPQYKNKFLFVPVYNPSLNKYKDKKLIRKIPGSIFRLLFVGRLEPVKGINVLFEALVGLHDIELYVVGDGSIKKILEDSVNKLKINDAVHFTGLLQQDEVFNLMENFDALVLPSYYEYTPNVIIEAQSIGLPVIASSTGGVKYLVKNKKTGLLFKVGNKNDLRNKINFLKNNHEFQEDLRMNAKNFIIDFFDKYSEENISKKLLNYACT